MKKNLVFAAAALLALASCTKVEDFAISEDQPISFQTVNYLSTKAASYANGDFGVSAWYKGDDSANNADFMAYQQVTGTNGTNTLWTTVGKTYYWPKSGSIDFIAYSPFEVKPTVAEDAITYATMAVGDKDILYSDKVIGATAKNSGNGVPLLFRHALAQVKFIVKPAYKEKWEPSTCTYTSWTIDFGTADFEISGVVNKGSLALTLGADNSWTKPNNSIWTPDATAEKITLKYVSPGDITADGYVAEPLAAKQGTPAYILPQASTSKTLSFTVSIKTFRGTGATEAEAKAAAQQVLQETNVPVKAAIVADDYYWPMNTITTYTLKVSPSYSGKIYIPVYVKDADGDGNPDLDEDGNPETTTNPDEALKDPEGDPTPAETPVYVKDEDHDGVPDDEDGDGKPDTTTDPDEALNGPTNPTPATDENGDPITEPIFEEKDAEGPVEIKFDPSVAPWETVTGTAVEVTK